MARARDRIATVVLNWNGSAHTQRCVERVRSQTCRSRLIVIDNGSTREDMSALQTFLGRSEIIALKKNIGFAAAMNLGMILATRADAEFVWLLNNDAFPDLRCLESLVARCDNDRLVAMLSPRLQNSDGREQHVGGFFDLCTLEPTYVTASRLADALSRGDDRLVWLTATAPLVRTAALARIGRLAGQFFAYCEDMDLSFRMRAGGWTVSAEPVAVATHLGNASTLTASHADAVAPLVRFLLARNVWLFMRRNLGNSTGQAAWLRYYASRLCKAGDLELAGDEAGAVATLAGLSAACRGRYGPPPRRFECGRLERLLLRHPWRFGQLIQLTANAMSLMRPRVA